MRKYKIIAVLILFLFIGSSLPPVISAYIKEQESSDDGWYFLEDYPNYAPTGLPDFSQRQHAWRFIVDGGNGIGESIAEGDDIQVTPYGKKIRNDDPVITMGPNCYLESTPGGDDIEFWNFCFLVSIANCLWWIDSQYEDPNGVPGDGIDAFPLVKDYGVGDDHASENVPLFINDLAHVQGLACYDDNLSKDIFVNLETWMENKGIGNMFDFTMYYCPSFGFITEEITQGKPVILNICFYKLYGNSYEFAGNHFISCAGVNSDEIKLMFSDPFLDVSNPNEHEYDYYYEHIEHNDAGNVSHDPYRVELGSPLSNILKYPPAKCWLPDYWPYYDYCLIVWATVIDELQETYNPPAIKGPSIGRTGKTYTYTFQSADPDVGEVSYYIDWGDNTFSGWTGYRSADDPLICHHNWNQSNINSIKVKIKDEHGKQSRWRELPITIINVKDIITMLFRLILQNLFHIIGLDTTNTFNKYACSIPMYLNQIKTLDAKRTL